VIARLPTGLHAARFLVLKIIYELRDGRFFNSEAFLAGMTDIHTGKPW
jgi:hypothetical protein